MKCSNCSPHNAHYGRCYVVAQSCGCQAELPPLPFKEGAEWEGERGTDDVHEDWEETGETGSLFVQEIERTERYD